MIRKRIAQHDDKAIRELVVKLLLPYAHKTQPNLRVDLAEIRTRLRPCKTFVIMTGGRKPCGFISLRPVKDMLYIDMLAVDARSQGKGLGSRLLQHAERTALQAGYGEVYLWVDEDNIQAQRFYSLKQFEPVHYQQSIRCYLLKKRIEDMQHRQFAY